MKNNDLLDNKFSLEDFSNYNMLFKLLGLGAMIFTSFVNLLYIFQFSFEYLGFKYGFNQYIVYFLAKFISISMIGVCLSYTLKVVKTKIRYNSNIVNKLIRVNLIILVIIVLFNRFFVNLIYKMIYNVHFDYGSDKGEINYYSFLEVAEPITDSIAIIILVLITIRLKAFINN